MRNIFHELLNPHCEHCAEEKREDKVCSSCETLREQLAAKTHECNQLMDRLLNPQKPVVEDAKPVNVTRPTGNITWNVRRQMLEAEDRNKAKLMAQAPQPIVTPPINKDVEELEKELGVEDTQKEA